MKKMSDVPKEMEDILRKMEHFSNKDILKVIQKEMKDILKKMGYILMEKMQSVSIKVDQMNLPGSHEKSDWSDDVINQ